MISAVGSIDGLRAALEADRVFLDRVYASTREEELELTNWTPEQKAAFCLMQSRAQDAHYRSHYPTAEYYVIESASEAVGRLYIDRWPNEIRIMDLAILPPYRGNGIGTSLLEQLQAEAQAAQKKLSVHVEQMNRALKLYQRFGFTQREQRGVYLLLEWNPLEGGAKSTS